MSKKVTLLAVTNFEKGIQDLTTEKESLPKTPTEDITTQSESPPPSPTSEDESSPYTPYFPWVPVITPAPGKYLH